MIGSLGLATPAAADPAEDASTKANIKPLVLDRIPADGSDPSADKTIWLDFAGGTLEGTSWNDQTGQDELVYQPADRLTAAQRLQVYQTVVQSFASFEVNVTINKPSRDELVRTSFDDDEYGAVAHVTDNTGRSPGFEKIFQPGFAGIAPHDGFGDAFRMHTWITTDVFGEETAMARAAAAADADTYRGTRVGQTVTHEIGHTLGLEHHGWKGPEGNFEYYTPGSDWTEKTASVWGPLMGNPLSGMARWSESYPGGNRKQDDLAVLTKDLSEKDATISRIYDGSVVWTGMYCTYDGSDKVVKSDGETCLEDEPLKRQNDYFGRLDSRDNRESHTDARARVLTLANGTAAAWGEFVENLDQGVGNWYRFDAGAGPISVNVVPQQPYSSLDLKVTLYDSELDPIGSNDPGLENVFDAQRRVVPGELKGQAAGLTETGTGPQTYFVKVEQVAFGDLDDNTATKASAAPRYGNLGTYQIAVQGMPVDELAAPTAEPTYGETVTGTGVPGATVAVDSAAGKLLGSAQVGPDGRYTVELDPAAKVGDELLVSQSQEGLRSRPVAVTVIEEAAPEVTVQLDRTKITEGDDKGVTVTGTGFEAGQKITGVVNSEPVDLGTKIAGDDGEVEFVFDAGRLEVGSHRVTLTAVDDEDYTGSAKLTVVEKDEDDGNPSPSPSPSPDDEETPSPGPEDDSDNPPPSDDGSDEGDLPGTGAGNALTLFGIGGLVLVGSGATIAVAARRRNGA